MTERRTILVVDDDEPVLLLMKNVLREFQYNALTASSGQQAIEIVSGTKPDLILLDLNMPGMNGDAVLDKLRDGDSQPVPIVILSGDPVDPEDLARLGAVDAIQKPFDLTDLLETIRSHVSKS
jgi:CheY-like chemotaxis protein